MNDTTTHKNSDQTNTDKLLVRGEQLINQEYRNRDVGKEGYLRGGSTGARIQGCRGPVSIGTCPRVAHLRALGIDPPVTFEKALMFGGGHASEERLNKSLTMAWEEQDPQNIYLPEGLVGIKWATASGRPVTSTPDGIYAVPDGSTIKFLKGVEAKCMSSGYSVISHMLREKPKASYLIQAGHYGWQLGIPFDLVCISRVNFHLDWMMKKLIKGLTPHPCYVYSDRDVNDKHALPKNFAPTSCTYKIKWERDRLTYTTPQGNTERTHVKTGDIRAFYDHVAQSLDSAFIPDKGAPKDIHGKQAMSPCTYCIHKSSCPTQDNGAKDSTYEQWIEQCKRNCEEVTTTNGLDISDHSLPETGVSTDSDPEQE